MRERRLRLIGLQKHEGQIVVQVSLAWSRLQSVRQQMPGLVGLAKPVERDGKDIGGLPVLGLRKEALLRHGTRGSPVTGSRRVQCFLTMSGQP